jgi:hypothetical protein
MSTISPERPLQVGLKMAWGMESGDPPSLPEGYRLVCHPREAVKAYSAEGVEHLVFMEPWRLVRVMDRDPVRHSTRCDFEHPIML